MFKTTITATLLALTTLGGAAASTISYTGTLSSAEDYVTEIVSVPTAGAVTLQTWGFGGGTNAAGTSISAGGFDPLVALFSGTGSSAQLIDGTSDILSNYSGYAGCPPAGTVTIGSSTGNCGDIRMSFSLKAGLYTVLLSDAAYIPNALFDNGTLGEGFTDFTPGSLPFQTCVGPDCITDTNAWALDVTVPSSPVPEPSVGMLLLFNIGLFAAGIRRARPNTLTQANEFINQNYSVPKAVAPVTVAMAGLEVYQCKRNSESHK